MAVFGRLSSWFLGRAADDRESSFGESLDDGAYLSGDSDEPEIQVTVDTDRNPGLTALRAAIEPRRRELLKHPLYDYVNSIPRMRSFMRYHVFAVWDFMCLAKRLQRDFTSLEVLWRPPQTASLARFINGIILAEESDTDADGVPMSHLEMYLGAMQEVGAPTQPFQRFMKLMCTGVAVGDALSVTAAPAASRIFVEKTLETVEHGTTIEVLASFLFGREDLIPEMFARFLPRWEASRAAGRFTHYVKRHIDLDGDDHGPAAKRAIVHLAGDDDVAWRQATAAARSALEARIALWDGVHREMLGRVSADADADPALTDRKMAEGRRARRLTADR